MLNATMKIKKLSLLAIFLGAACGGEAAEDPGLLPPNADTLAQGKATEVTIFATSMIFKCPPYSGVCPRIGTLTHFTEAQYEARGCGNLCAPDENCPCMTMFHYDPYAGLTNSCPQGDFRGAVIYFVNNKPVLSASFWQNQCYNTLSKCQDWKGLSSNRRCKVFRARDGW